MGLAGLEPGNGSSWVGAWEQDYVGWGPGTGLAVLGPGNETRWVGAWERD